MGWQHDALPTLVEDLDAHNPWGPSNDITTRAVKNHIFWVLLNQHDELVGNAEQTVHVQWLAEIPCTDTPGNGSNTEQVCILPWLHLLLLLGSKVDEAELDRIVNCRCADKVLSQVFQVLLSCACCHCSELFWLVCCIFSINNLGEQEVPENRGLWKSYRLGNRWPERRHVFRSGHSHAVNKEGNQRLNNALTLSKPQSKDLWNSPLAKKHSWPG